MGDTFNITDEGGESRLTGLIFDPGATSGDVLTVQDDGSIAAAPGGGSQPGALVRKGPFTVAHNAAGLTTGVPIYTPAVGEWLMNGVIIPTTGFDGITPLADLGPGSGGRGLFNYQIGSPIPVDASAESSDFGNLSMLSVPDLAGAGALSMALDGVTVTGSTLGLSASPITGELLLPSVPSPFVSTDPVTVWVTQDGLAGSAAPGSTVGSLDIYLWLCSAP